MILSANQVKISDIVWEISISCTTVPTSVVYSDKYSSNSLSFTVVNSGSYNIIKILLNSSNNEFNIKLNTESKLMKFMIDIINDENDNDIKGDILAETFINSTQQSIYIPYTDLNLINMKFYDSNNNELLVQTRENSPVWMTNVFNVPEYRTIKNKRVLTARVTFWTNNLQYLINEETNTWAPLRNIPYMVVINGLTHPALSHSNTVFADIDSDLYNKSYYAYF